MKITILENRYWRVWKPIRASVSFSTQVSALLQLHNGSLFTTDRTAWLGITVNVTCQTISNAQETGVRSGPQPLQSLLSLQILLMNMQKEPAENNHILMNSSPCNEVIVGNTSIHSPGEEEKGRGNKCWSNSLTHPHTKSI